LPAPGSGLEPVIESTLARAVVMQQVAGRAGRTLPSPLDTFSEYVSPVDSVPYFSVTVSAGLMAPRSRVERKQRSRHCSLALKSPDTIYGALHCVTDRSVSMDLHDGIITETADCEYKRCHLIHLSNKALGAWSSDVSKSLLISKFAFVTPTGIEYSRLA
jgi:hypothetical protein